MAGVTSHRLRTGAAAWLLTLQFFVVETIAALRVDGPYSRVDDVISDLGTAASPAAALMNASFVLQSALILGGALLLRPALGTAAGQAATALLGAAAAGVLLVGVFPSDGNSTMHAIGAVLYLLGGGLGLIALAYALRPRSEAVGTGLALLGLLGTAMTVFFFTGVTAYLGEGGTERVAAYVLPLALAVAGPALARLDPPAGTSTAGTRREERERARAERAERARERDEALEAVGRRGAAADRGVDGAAGAGADEFDPDDPWATPRRRAD
jgi:hypothetical membrane protein